MEKMDTSSLLGQYFEIFVKRGILDYLIYKVPPKSMPHEVLNEWFNTTSGKVYQRFIESLHETECDPNWITSTLNYLAFCGQGMGQCVIREIMNALSPLSKNVLSIEVHGVWSPLTFPGDDGQRHFDEAAFKAFCHAMKYDPAKVSMNEVIQRGGAARSDFALWFSYEVKRRKRHVLMVFEMSLNALFDLEDFTDSQVMQRILSHTAKMRQSRGVFSSIVSELEEEALIEEDRHYQISHRLAEFFYGFTSSDKPMLKLMQGCSYAHSHANIIERMKDPDVSLDVHVVSITTTGVEHLCASANDDKDFRWKLMKSFGQVYREVHDISFEKVIEKSLAAMKDSLPPVLADKISAYEEDWKSAKDKANHCLTIEFEEEVPRVFNPNGKIGRSDCLLIGDEQRLIEKMGFSTPQSFWNYVDASSSLREVHARAIEGAIKNAVSNRINLLCLEGNPGIGKTTAVRKTLFEYPGDFLFYYVSPRTAINKEVSRKFGESDSIVSLTTDHLLSKYYGTREGKSFEGVVLIGGKEREEFVLKNILFTPDFEQKQSKFKGHEKEYIRDDESRLVRKSHQGVLRTLFHAAYHLHNEKGHRRLALFSSIQSLKGKDAKDTTLSNLKYLVSGSNSGIRSSAQAIEFARKFPLMVFMIDEITGDSSGVNFLFELKKFLQELYDAIKDESLRPTVLLIVADASLVNDIVFARHIESLTGKEGSVPDRVFVSPSFGEKAFAVSQRPIPKLGADSVFHIMANSIPAGRLSLKFKAWLTQHASELEESNHKKRVDRIVQEVGTMLDDTKNDVLVFLQSKHMNERIKHELKRIHGSRIDVEIINESISSKKKEEIIKKAREKTSKSRVFIMTSSGARGIDLPLVDRYLIEMPKFSLESSLMEIVQVIYRGRGEYVDEEGTSWSGDLLDRKISFFIDDSFSHRGDEKKRWARFFDLICMMVLLRGSVLTRMTADAGIRNKRLGFIPVGAISLDKGGSQMYSSYFKDFYEKLNYNNDLRIEKMKKELLSWTKLIANNFIIEANNDILNESFRRYFMEITNVNVPLLRYDAMNWDDYLQMNPFAKNDIFVDGPFLLQKIQNDKVKNRLEMDERDVQIRNIKRRFLEHLNEILKCKEEDIEYNKNNLKKKYVDYNFYNIVDSIKKILEDKFQQRDEKHFITHEDQGDLWLCVPLNWMQWRSLCSADTHGFWFNALYSMAGIGTPTTPIPFGGLQEEEENDKFLMSQFKSLYRDVPFLYFDHRDPVRQAVLFDDRFFYVSPEMNLLNAILL